MSSRREQIWCIFMLFKMKCNRYYFLKMKCNMSSRRELVMKWNAILYMWCPHYAKFLDPSLNTTTVKAHIDDSSRQ
jgi:hypothetical protein